MQKVNIDFIPIANENSVFAGTKVDDFYIAMASTSNSIYIGNQNSDSYLRVGAGTIDISAVPLFKNGISYGENSLSITETNDQHINFNGKSKNLLLSSANNTVITPRLEVEFEADSSLLINKGDIYNSCCYINTKKSDENIILQGNSGNIAIGIEKVPSVKVEIGNRLHIISSSKMSSYLDMSPLAIDTSESDLLFIQANYSNNNVGIGFNDRPPQAKLEVNGTMYISELVYSSDDRIKTEEKLITNAVATMQKLNPQTYIKNNTRMEAGLIAQEVYYSAPELRHLIFLPSDVDKETIDSYNINTEANSSTDLTHDPEYKGWGKHMAGVNYIELIPYLITALKETTATICELKDRVNDLENKLK